MKEIPKQRPFVRVYLDELEDTSLLNTDLLRLMETRADNLRKAMAKQKEAS